MKKSHRVMLEIFHRFHTRGERFFNQRELAKTCGLSVGTVNPLISKLRQLGAVEIKPLGFRLIDPRRALLYWAFDRNLPADILYSTHAPMSAEEMEGQLSGKVIFTAYSAFRRIMPRSPASYREVFVYGDSEIVMRMFRPREGMKPNLYVLELDEHLRKLSQNGTCPAGQVYVDLWQLGASASRFVEELEPKILSPISGLSLIAMEKIKKARGEFEKSG
ncbi:MAG: hypothetical protein QW567_04035 [Candidatus Hadarchaeales archaeon]